MLYDIFSSLSFRVEKKFSHLTQKFYRVSNKRLPLGSLRWDSVKKVIRWKLIIWKLWLWFEFETFPLFRFQFHLNMYVNSTTINLFSIFSLEVCSLFIVLLFWIMNRLITKQLRLCSIFNINLIVQNAQTYLYHFASWIVYNFQIKLPTKTSSPFTICCRRRGSQAELFCWYLMYTKMYYNTYNVDGDFWLKFIMTADTNFNVNLWKEIPHFSLHRPRDLWRKTCNTRGIWKRSKWNSSWYFL